MKKIIAILLCCCPLVLFAQDTSFMVGGDADKFYPVTFRDWGWAANTATELEIGRSVMHTNFTNAGSIIAKFRFHMSNWGHGSNFIDADIRSAAPGATYADFIAGYADATTGNGALVMVVWLRGGGLSYYIKSNYQISATVYVPGPYVTTIGASYGHKTGVDGYVNNQGPSIGGRLVVRDAGRSVIAGQLGLGTYTTSNNLSLPDVSLNDLPVGISWYNATANPTEYGIHRTAGAWAAPAYQQLRLGWKTGILLEPGTGYTKSFVNITGDGLRVTSGSVGIGTTVTGDYKLAVEGTVGARKIKVTSVPNWADHVFSAAHQRPGLLELEQYIHQHKHLPGIPTEAEVKRDGIDVVEMNAKLLEKVEELTLYIIELKKEVEALKKK
ncbi:hypothetical protein [Chitinophaga barathri]|uniref:Uncharacterized protein n=1 Tax=Chitinophaga barathri TaxID=1647451 RepID=A0A3N4MPI3_9BACT|nr:hypothetical protein [Chitinophaga barathri]RPD42000.1 hypothetical protein EG028_07530 [Chitinophaga barathri]